MAAVVAVTHVEEVAERQLAWSLHWATELLPEQLVELVRRLHEVEEPDLEQVTSRMANIALAEAELLQQQNAQTVCSISAEAQLYLIAAWYGMWPLARRERLLHHLAALTADLNTPSQTCQSSRILQRRNTWPSR